MTYSQAEQYVLSLMNLRRKEYMSDPRHCGLYLKRVLFFLDLIGNPQDKIPHYIHVTGTSGKGSTSRFLHNILHAARHKTGMLTSPHPTRITERWVINGKEMTKKEFVQIVTWMKPLVEEYLRTTPYDMVSFAELMTIIGLHYFAMNNVSHAVIEVACGGRYDATNIIPHKDAAIITNIGLDHTNIWPTKKDIAIEKSGIITKTKKVYTAEASPIFRSIILQEAKKKRAPSMYLPNTSTRILEESLDGIMFRYDGQTYHIPCLGKHQARNAALAIAVTRDLGISEPAISRGLSRTTQPLRMEHIDGTSIILDSGHNTDKIRSTVETLKHLLKKQKKRVHLLVGFSADKELRSMTRLLNTLNPTQVTCTRQTVNPFRKVEDPQTISTHFPRANTSTFLDPIEALEHARQQHTTRDILLVTGSTFLAGELRPYLTRT